MIYQNGHLARPLDAALSASSRVAVLRTLRGAPQGRTGREVARLANINHQSAAEALHALEKLGLLEKKKWGRKISWRLDRRRWLVSEVLEPLFKKELEHAELISAEIKTELKGLCKAVLLIGDAAHGRLLPNRPLSIIVIESGQKRLLNDVIRELTSVLKERWNVELECQVVSAAQGQKIAAVEDAWRLLPNEGRGFIA